MKRGDRVCGVCNATTARFEKNGDWSCSSCGATGTTVQDGSVTRIVVKTRMKVVQPAEVVAFDDGKGGTYERRLNREQRRRVGLRGTKRSPRSAVLTRMQRRGVPIDGKTGVPMRADDIGRALRQQRVLDAQKKLERAARRARDVAEIAA